LEETKWCGAGNKGKNHDLCPLYFLKDNKKYGYKYNNFVTLSHCECDKIVNIFILILKGFIKKNFKIHRPLKNLSL